MGAAALEYFGKPVSELTLAECASLISITNNPSLYGPYSFAKAENSKGEMWTARDWNKYRQEVVLYQMLDQGKITRAEYDEAVAQDLSLDQETLDKIDAIAREYEAAGADAVSCLTEPKWFLGSDGIFQAVRREISLPMLRKDFTVDEYQIYQARYLGAEAVLLICSLLETETLARFLDLAHRLGLAALVEAHDEKEIRSAVEAGAEIIGVNNRNLKDFSVDFSNAARLRDKIPPDVLYVAESGVSSAEECWRH